MCKYKMLFVDDEPEILNCIRRNLHKMEDVWELFYATNGEEALEMTTKICFDIIITDAKMPNMTGGELVIALKLNQSTKNIPVMMLTGYADVKIKTQALENGVIEFVYKPILPGELIMRITNILKFKKLNDELKELNEQKNYFLGIAAHDLRNPLQTVITIVNLFQLVYEEQLDDAQKHKLELVLKEVNFMNELISDFLDVSSIESGKFFLNMEKISLFDLFNDNIELYTNLAKNKNITLEYCYNGMESHEISVDPSKIRQAVGNLMTNAIKFSFLNSKVVFAVNRLDNEMHISIQDFGPGIPLEEHEKLFKPFGRTSIRTTGGEKSTGLGLAIVKKITEAHNGRIDMQSIVGTGSTFTIILPNG